MLCSALLCSTVDNGANFHASFLTSVDTRQEARGHSTSTPSLHSPTEQGEGRQPAECIVRSCHRGRKWSGRQCGTPVQVEEKTFHRTHHSLAPTASAIATLATCVARGTELAGWPNPKLAMPEFQAPKRLSTMH